MTEQPPPPGWYNYPGGGGMRYWDGQQWTDAPAAPAPIVSAPTAAPWQRVLGWMARHPKLSIGGAVLLFVMIVGGAFGSDDTTTGDDEADDGNSAGSADVKDEPKIDDKPSEKATPEKPAKPVDQLQDAVDDSDAEAPHVEKWLGKDSWIVEFDVKDNLSNNLMRTGIGQDVFDMLEQIDDDAGDVKIKEIAFRGLFPLVDKFGNEEDGQVFFTRFKGTVVPKINYDEILVTTFDNIPNLAAGGTMFVHPDLQD